MRIPVANINVFSRWEAKSALAAMMLLSFGVMAFFNSPAVQAAPTSMGAFNADSLYTSQEGSNIAVTASSCDVSASNTTYVKTFVSGSLNSSITRNGSADWFAPICNQTGFMVTHDSTAYVYQLQNSGNSFNRRLAAYKHGTLQGTPQTIDLCATEPVSPQWAETLYPTEGAAGAVYYLAGGGSSCTAPQKKFVAIDGATGQTKFTVPLLGSGGGQGEQFPHIFAWINGVAVLDGGYVRYFDLAGNEDVARRQTVDASRVIEARGSDNGRVYVRLSPATATVNGCNADSQLLYFNADGTKGSVTTDNCSFQTGVMASAPNNSLVLLGGVGGSSNGYDDRLIKYDASGAVVYDKDISQLNDYTNIINSAPKIDANGNAIIITTAKSVTTGDNDVVTSLYDPAGVRTQLATTATDGTPDVYDNFRTSQNASIALAPKHAYVTTCHFDAPYFNNCSTANDVSLVDVLANVSYEFPASSILAPPTPKLKYVALGDGYASGEGLAPYTTPSDVNGCHRSAQAYPQLLTAVSTLGLGAPTNVACSGATTTTALNGGKEPSQLSALQAPANLVTLTIGADDVNFLGLARSCMTGANCLLNGQSGMTALNIGFDLPNKLGRLFQAIKAKPGVTATTRVLVVGYPALVGNPDSATPDCGKFSIAERYALLLVGAQLNQVMRNETNRAGFEYVDATATGSPLRGHEPCTSGSYFNSPVTAPAATALYPNEQGQAAYAQLVKNYLIARPLAQ